MHFFLHYYIILLIKEKDNVAVIIAQPFRNFQSPERVFVFGEKKGKRQRAVAASDQEVGRGGKELKELLNQGMAEIEALRARAMASIPLSARRHRLPLPDDKEEGELSSSSDKVLVTTLSFFFPSFFVSHNWPLSMINHQFRCIHSRPFFIAFFNQRVQ